jgi:PPOX class probable F420-dependent enzyme
MRKVMTLVERDDHAAPRTATPIRAYAGQAVRAPASSAGPAVRAPGSSAGPAVRAPGWSADLDDRLSAERIAWLTTVRDDGAPHVVPIWFLWDGTAFTVFSKPMARKVRNIAAEGRVMLAVGDPQADFDVQLIEGEAHLDEHPTAEILDARLVDKYGPWMAEIALSPAEYAATYSQAIQVVPTRFLPWRGRTGGRRLAATGGRSPARNEESAPPATTGPRSSATPIGSTRMAHLFAPARPFRRNHPSVAFAPSRPRVSFAPRGSRLL